MHPISAGTTRHNYYNLYSTFKYRAASDPRLAQPRADTFISISFFHTQSLSTCGFLLFPLIFFSLASSPPFHLLHLIYSFTSYPLHFYFVSSCLLLRIIFSFTSYPTLFYLASFSLLLPLLFSLTTSSLLSYLVSSSLLPHLLLFLSSSSHFPFLLSSTYPHMLLSFPLISINSFHPPPPCLFYSGVRGTTF